MSAYPGYRCWNSYCPFCGTLNTIPDGTGILKNAFSCSHFKHLQQGESVVDAVFQDGKTQKSGLTTGKHLF